MYVCRYTRIKKHFMIRIYIYTYQISSKKRAVQKGHIIRAIAILKLGGVQTFGVLLKP